MVRILHLNMLAVVDCLMSVTMPQAMRAVIEHSGQPDAEPSGSEAAPARFDPDRAPLLISIEDPAMKANSSALMVISQQLDLVRMCFEIASELSSLRQGAA